MGATGSDGLAGARGAILCTHDDNQSIVWHECHFSFMSFLCDVAYQICQAEDHLETGQQDGLWHCLTDNHEHKEPKREQNWPTYQEISRNKSSFILCAAIICNLINAVNVALRGWKFIFKCTFFILKFSHVQLLWETEATRWLLQCVVISFSSTTGNAGLLF